MKRLSFLLTLLLLFSVSCKVDEGAGNPCQADFDQEAMFANMADNIILPTYTDFDNAVTSLAAVTEQFVNLPDVQTLDVLREKYVDAYLVWQRVSPYEFGPAEEFFLRSSINNFPLNIEQVNTNIQSGIYDFSMPDEYDKGFPALDYLLYGIGLSDEEIIALYGNNENYRLYLSDVINDIQTRFENVFMKWVNGYRESFITNTGTAAGTSLSHIINQLNQNYEIIKREKLGVPSGVLTLGFTNPDKVEAYFSGHSTELAIAALEVTEQLYSGKTNDGVDGPGLDDYLIKVNAEKDEQLLDAVIKNQFTLSLAALRNLEGPDPLSAIIENNNDLVIEAYNEITRQLVNIKTDMPSVLCVSITYIDNPSDSD